jgi:hypothetical protein
VKEMQMAKANKESWHWTWAQGLLTDLSIGVKLKETTQREIDE